MFSRSIGRSNLHAVKLPGGIIPSISTHKFPSLIGRSGSSTFKPSTATFQTIHHCSVDVARGLVLLFGIGTTALVWGFLVKKFKQGSPYFFFVSFFVRFESLFLRPDRGFAHAGARRSCQGWPLYQPCGILQPC